MTDIFRSYKQKEYTVMCTLFSAGDMGCYSITMRTCAFG